MCATRKVNDVISETIDTQTPAAETSLPSTSGVRFKQEEKLYFYSDRVILEAHTDNRLRVQSAVEEEDIYCALEHSFYD
jgi:hypothetical protein